MRIPIRTAPGRRAVASVEVAVVLPLLLILLLGIWEVGRMSMVQNVLDNAAREGARLAATGAFFASNNHTDPTTGSTLTLPLPSANGDYEVQKRVITYLNAAGLNTAGANVTVQNLAKSWAYSYPGGGAGSGSDPAVAADQLDHLRVTVTLPYSSIQWSATSLFVSPSAVLQATSDWYSMRNVPLAISTTIPSRPVQPGDPLP